MKACILNSTGNYKNLNVTNIPDLSSSILPNDLLIRHTALGINYDDIMYRSGRYQIPLEIKMNPLILGFEGVGIIEKKGQNIKGFNVGDQVGYAFCPLGAYTEKRFIDYRFVFSIPNEIDPEMAAATIRKGLTAEYLLFKCANLKEDDWILIHSVVGGVGQFLAKWARFNKINVIGTVGDESKIATALAIGCNHIINRKTEDFQKKVLEITNGNGVKVVYDGIGKSVYEKSYNCLTILGLYVSYGYVSGFINPIDIAQTRLKSAFFTSPTIEVYKSNRFELVLSANSVISMMQKGVLSPNISRYTFAEIPRAHVDLESGKTIGSLVVNV